MTLLAEKLSDVRKSFFGAIPRVRHQMQLIASTARSGADERQQAVAHVLNWASKKWRGRVPREAFSGSPFEYDQAGLRIAAERTENGVWMFRSEHLDTTAARTWLTEAIVADGGGVNIVGCRNSCSTSLDEALPLSVPGFLQQWIGEVGLKDGPSPIESSCRDVRTREGFGELMALVLAPARKMPVVVVSVTAAGRPELDVHSLSKSLRGVAHVASVTSEVSFAITDYLGKSLSVFLGAVRTYYPGFSKEADPYRHPLILPHQIEKASDRDLESADAIQAFLARVLFAYSVQPSRLDDMPSFSSVRRKALSTSAASAEDRLSLLRLELEDERQSHQEWKALAEQTDETLSSVTDELHRLRAQNLVLSESIRTLRERNGTLAVAALASYADLSRWVDENFSDRLFLCARAVRSAKGATFKDIALVGDALRLLAEEYWSTRTATPQTRVDANARLEDAKARLKVEITPTGDPTRLAEFKEHYTVNYRVGHEPKQWLDTHLKFGSIKDDQLCLRIYFFWDYDRQLVVVGHLPSHLPSRAS